MSAEPKTKNESPERGAAHERLNVFVGKWHSKGDSYAAGQKKDDPRGSIEKWVSDETVEWLPGRFFLMQRWDAMTGVNEFKGTAIVSHDPETGDHLMRAYENHGFINDYVTRVEGDIWIHCRYKSRPDRIHRSRRYPEDHVGVAAGWKNLAPALRPGREASRLAQRSSREAT
jgi:hypothetical protein